jgi:hypothetical protein
VALALGYAVLRARLAGTEVDWLSLLRVVNSLAEKVAEVQRLERELQVEEKKCEPPPGAEPPPAGGTA